MQMSPIAYQNISTRLLDTPPILFPNTRWLYYIVYIRRRNAENLQLVKMYNVKGRRENHVNEFVHSRKNLHPGSPSTLSAKLIFRVVLLARSFTRSTSTYNREKIRHSFPPLQFFCLYYCWRYRVPPWILRNFLHKSFHFFEFSLSARMHFVFMKITKLWKFRQIRLISL